MAAKQVQVDESEFLEGTAVRKAVEEIMNNKEARKLLLKARKIVDPNAPIPELDAAEPVNAELATIREQLAETRKALADDKAEREARARTAEFAQRWDAQRSALRRQGFTDEGISAIEKHAEDKGIPDLEIAAAHWEKLNPPPPPVEPNGAFGKWNFFEEPAEEQGAYMKALLETKGESDAVSDREAMNALRQLRGQGGRR